MLIDFFLSLRAHKLPVSIIELTDLLSALEQQLVFCDLEQFYHLARTILVKDEKFYDRFDRVYAAFFKGIDTLSLEKLLADLPEEWLKKIVEKTLSPEERAQLEKYDLETLMKMLEARLKEQKHRHQGGNKMIGTGGTSPFGAFGDHPTGIRIGGHSRNRSAVKVWEERRFKNLDDSLDITERNTRVALRALRKMTRVGIQSELDLDSTIHATAQQAGWLDIKMQAEKKNAIKLLVFFDVGGSMDQHVRTCEELFSAFRSEVKHLEYYYFHNCFYESVWHDNFRRSTERVPTLEVLNKFNSDYKVIIIGDATMSPYEIGAVGGSVEHRNEETGEVWLTRVKEHFNKVAWLNPEPIEYWEHVPSLKWVQTILKGHMFPMTVDGLGACVDYLMKGGC